MFEELNRELADAKEKIRRKNKLKGMLEQTNDTLQKELDRKKELEKILQDENSDVKKLESFSITSIFYSILGSKEQQLDKERQEQLAALLKYDECSNSVLALEKEFENYKASLNELNAAEGEYETALEHKKELMLQMNDTNSQKLLQLMENLAQHEMQKKELVEAIEAGNNAKNELKKVIKALESAEGWGTWDILGGGLLATAAKHSDIDEAQEYVKHTKIALIKFQNELKDVDIPMNIEINIGDFETFADYFFDGLISDWVVQSEIDESLNNVIRVKDSVNGILDSLKERLNSVQNDIFSAAENIKLFIEQI